MPAPTDKLVDSPSTSSPDTPVAHSDGPRRLQRQFDKPEAPTASSLDSPCAKYMASPCASYVPSPKAAPFLGKPSNDKTRDNSFDMTKLQKTQPEKTKVVKSTEKHTPQSANETGDS